MKSKIVLLVCAALACAALNGLMDVVLQQPVSSALAVSQLADDEIAAATMRSYSHLSNLFPIVSWITVALFGFVLFRAEVIKAIKSAQ